MTLLFIAKKNEWFLSKRSKIYNEHLEKFCEACGHSGHFYKLTIDHFKTRGSGGGDEKEKCITLCIKCHFEKGSMSREDFAEKYPNVRLWLDKNGWEFCDIRKNTSERY